MKQPQRRLYRVTVKPYGSNYTAYYWAYKATDVKRVALAQARDVLSAKLTPLDFQVKWVREPDAVIPYLRWPPADLTKGSA